MLRLSLKPFGNRSNLGTTMRCPKCDHVSGNPGSCPNGHGPLQVSGAGSMGARLAGGLVVLVVTLGLVYAACIREKPNEKPTSAVPAAAESKTDATCPLVAKRFIQRGWKCDLNMSGITPEQLCAGDNRQATSSMRYLGSIETCNEFLAGMNISK